ncbi:hypothetical protein SELMODRAFT_154093, partial [Selaginella moellendorffii]
MGKNQAYKAMQRAKMSSHTGSVADDLDDGLMDGSFHSPEWHAARLASLQTSHTITWEEFKRKQKEEARKQNELEDGEARMMREYRAQLDAERAAKLSRGRNHVDKRDTRFKKDKDKDKDKKKPKRKEDGASSSASSSDDTSEAKKDKRKVKKERKKRRKAMSESSGSESSYSDDNKKPMRLSTFF